MADQMESIQLLGETPKDIASKAVVRRAVFNLFSSVCNYITAAVKSLKHSDIGT